MDFRTQIDILKTDLVIHHQQRILLLGSCFAENIGERLSSNLFNIKVNPFGITYNPFSVSKILNLLLDGYQFLEEDILYDKGLYFTLMHHSLFSENNKEVYLKKINLLAQQSSTWLLESDLLLLTFGTSYVYRWKQNDEIVNNCHKLPTSSFERERVTVSQIVDEWSCLIERLVSLKKEIKFVFTVSPIRHWKDGAHNNQVSKAVLLLAIDELQKLFPRHTYYFPSYELILDELRDYRFYAEDMFHPSEIAIEYCWKRFSEVFFEKETQKIVQEWQSLSRAMSHKSFHIESDTHQAFLKRTVEKLEKFAGDYPFLDCEKQIGRLKDNIK